MSPIPRRSKLWRVDGAGGDHHFSPGLQEGSFPVGKFHLHPGRPRLICAASILRQDDLPDQALSQDRGPRRTDGSITPRGGERLDDRSEGVVPFPQTVQIVTSVRDWYRPTIPAPTTPPTRMAAL